MKKILLFTFLIFCCALTFGQSKMVCCSNPSATQQFAMLASSQKFRMSHLKPLPLHFQSNIGKSITYKTPDGKTAGAFEFKAKNPTNNYLLVVHEWWGLNDWVKKESEKIYTDLGNVTVIDLDLYDGKVATTQAESGKDMQGVNEDRAKAIINGAIAYVGAKAHIYTIGWCFGGGWSLQSALLAGTQASGCVMYYGMPEEDVKRLKKLHCDVMGKFSHQ